MRWKTLEEGIQQLREVAILKVLFKKDRQHDNDPDKVRCTRQMLWSLANLGPSQYTTFIATIDANTNRETVGSVANKLRNYESIINSPMQAHISAVIKEFKEKMKEMKEEMKKVNAAPVQVTGPKFSAQHSPARDRGYTPRANLWFFLRDHEKDMSINFLQNGYYKNPKGLRWAFEIAAVEAENIKQLNTLPGLSENPSAVGLLKVEEQRVPIATSTVHRRQYQTDQDAVIPIHRMIRELKSQGVVSKTHSPFNSPI
ncbi:hypothetical protein HGM15179_004679 [Zosterops borbonicus]|nr:hypothetical protein HGM15179_006992 [Zosterops borbonicus]TRZ22406.1 hypothetical protein HGM15179_004679 [Zosterops borbonicus]